MAPKECWVEFGKTIRVGRQTKQISLRRFAEMVGMSPTYLSKVERGELPPPAEEKVVAIARALDRDPDELLALAGRVASDLSQIIRRHPRELATFLRAANGLSASEIKRLAREAEKGRQSP
jgi:HTH-type transcriptional regulator, competence development regulator